MEEMQNSKRVANHFSKTSPNEIVGRRPHEVSG